MGRCKSHNIKLNKPDFSVSATDRCACFLWILIPSISFCTQSWSVSYAAENTCSPSSSQVRHIPTFQPSYLWVVANLSPGWAARTGRAWKKIHVTELLLLIPVTTTVLLRGFSISPRRWSLRRGHSWLNTAGGSIAHGEEGKVSSLLTTKLNCHLCLNLWQYISQRHAQVECCSCWVPHQPASAQEQNQTSSSMFFAFIFVAPFPVCLRVIT